MDCVSVCNKFNYLLWKPVYWIVELLHCIWECREPSNQHRGIRESPGWGGLAMQLSIYLMANAEKVATSEVRGVSNGLTSR